MAPQRELTDDQKHWADVVTAMRANNLERFNVRRTLEWRVSLTLWAGLALAANALKNKDWEPWTWQFIVLVAGAVFVVVLHGWWEARNVVPSAKRDRDEGKDLAETLYEIVGLPKPDDLVTRPPYRSARSHYWQVGVTAVIAVFMVMLTTD
jgi:hypothetical protein